ncbi:unnamed protein product [Acanthocheilonema viteae]|nr:unnamed protein product [Acanthocheilonema viteae]
MHLGSYSPRAEPQVVQPHDMQLQDMQPRVVHKQSIQPFGVQPYDMRVQDMRLHVPQLQGEASAIQLQDILSQAADKTCGNCIITVNCGGKDCLPTKQSTIWIPPTREPIRLTLPPAPKAAWTFETRTTQTPKPTSRECRMCPCYAPQQCQMCPSCK